MKTKDWRIGNKNNWKGMDANYNSKHAWINRNYGKASHCENDITHESKVFDWANISGEYKREVNDYKQLCRSCHRTMDNGDLCKRGHKLTEENTSIKQKKGQKPYRSCKSCARNWMRQYRTERIAS
jgi:hypothetical protein